MTYRWRVHAFQIALIVVGFAIWQWGFALKPTLPWLVPDVLDPYFISKPSEIWTRLLQLGCFTDRTDTWIVSQNGAFAQCLARSNNNLWIATVVTLKNTFWGFVIGVSSGFIVGLVLGRSRFLAEVFEPFIVAFNSIPRIALVPLILMMFGLGDASKIVTAWLLVFFLVFFNTFEGARQVDRDLVAVARLLHAKEWQITAKVIIPSTLTWVFASLTPAISFALIGVIVGEFIGAERGLGRMMMEAEARGEASVMMAAILLLMVVGVVLSFGVRALQAYLLRWQPKMTR
jgi:NitT/TauT family transport system permease protein